jgi:RNA polymerase sigma-70 factor (ECF subfamily)
MSPDRYHLHEDKLLLALLRQGDQHAFDVIYTRYARELLVKAHYKTGVREISEDIVQDIFTGLWVKREQIEVRQCLGRTLSFDRI